MARERPLLERVMSAAWSTFEPVAPNVTRIAMIWDVPVLEVSFFYDLYIRKFQNGPEVFWPWYRRQRRERPFEPLHPHEVFPQLMENDCGFYQHEEA